jgi:hypothetical protein
MADTFGHIARPSPAFWVAPELADPLGTLEVGEHQDVEQFGATGTSRRCRSA